MTIRRMLSPWLLAAAVLVSPAALSAQQTPEEVAQAYFAHLRAGEMDRVAALMHPRALESFRDLMVRLMEGEELHDSPLAGREDLATMPADSFYVALMSISGEEEEFRDLLHTLEVQPLGHVAQGDSLAHVVYAARMSFMSQEAQQTTLLTLRRHGGAWRVDPGDGLMNMMGGGLMMLMMNAGMQAGMAAGFGGMESFDIDVDIDDDDEDEDEDEEDEDEDEDEDHDDPPSF